MAGEYVLEKDGLMRQEVLRSSHHKVMHLQDTEKDFVKYCKTASRLTKSFFMGNTEKNKKEKKLRKQELLEERNFTFAVRNSLSDETPIDVIYIEDIEAGKVLFHDPPHDLLQKSEPSSHAQHQLQPRMQVSSTKVQLLEYFPEGYIVKPHEEININRAIRRIMHRAKHCSKLLSPECVDDRPQNPEFKRDIVSDQKCKKKVHSLSSSSSSDDSSLSSIKCSDSLAFYSSTLKSSSKVYTSSYSESSGASDSEESLKGLSSKKKKAVYNLKTRIGDAIIQRRFESLKGKTNVQDDEIIFYRKACELVEAEKFHSNPRFEKTENVEDYINWVSADPTFLPHVLDCTEENQSVQNADIDEKALVKLFNPSLYPVEDFYQAIAVVKEARIYSLADIENNDVIFGGLKASCKCKGKTYPFQDVLYVTKTPLGEKIIRGLDKKTVHIPIPTINLLPYRHSNLKLEFLRGSH